MSLSILLRMKKIGCDLMENAIEIEKLTKKFGEFTAVNDVTFNVKKGEVFGFLGANGSGKTTVIRMLMGLITPTSGNGTVLGYDISKDKDSEIIRNKIGYMSQKFSLYEDLTVEENLNFYGQVYGLSGNKLDEKKKEVIAMADLEGRENMITANLSGGWKQRLALGCSILHDPEVLFLDEPTGGVDPIARRTFWDLIYKLSDSGVTILVTTHYMDEAEHCNTIGFIHYGNLLTLETPNNMKKYIIDGDIIEIKVKDTLKTIEILEGNEMVREASVYGTGVHALVEPELPLNDLEEYLKDEKIEYSSIKKVKPSLEDVFVFMVNKENSK